MSTHDKLEILEGNAVKSLNELLIFVKTELSDEVTPFDILEHINGKIRLIPTVKKALIFTIKNKHL